MACPDLEQLAQFCSDALSPLLRSQVVAHLDSCGTCAQLLSELSLNERLLGQILDYRDLIHEAAAVALPETIAASAFAGEVTVRSESSGGFIGPYRILREIGRGGMGVVYEAEQPNPRRAVALKVIRPGFVSASALRRFDLEATVLGRLKHPGIAQIYEAGTAATAEGVQPFFAMEFVGGQPLDQYIKQRELRPRQSLELMAQICDAVHYAHQQGVIHRDLKPANILVNDEAQPKILDFGVARVTDSDLQATTLQTNVGVIVGTLLYMSPEQVGADPNELDIRSDVYSLGVIAYQMLSGSPPYDLSRRMLSEAVRVICEEEPTPMSTTNRIFRGDIETIVATAMSKDKTRRYGSAAELAADIRRYLRNEPILARPPSAIYNLRLFTRRHKALVSSVLGVVATILAAAIVSTFLFLDARAARDRASLEAKNANFVAEAARADLWQSVSELLSLNARFRHFRRAANFDNIAVPPIFEDPEAWLRELLPEIHWDGEPQTRATPRFTSHDVYEALKSIDQWRSDGRQSKSTEELFHWIRAKHDSLRRVVASVHAERWIPRFQPTERAQFLEAKSLPYWSETKVVSYFSVTRVLAACLIIDAWQSTETGDGREAAKTLRAVDRLANYAGDNGTLTGLLTECAIKMNLLQHGREMMMADVGRGRDLSLIADAIVSVRPVEDVSIPMVVEALRSRQIVSQACRYRHGPDLLTFDTTLLGSRGLQWKDVDWDADNRPLMLDRVRYEDLVNAIDLRAGWQPSGGMTWPETQSAWAEVASDVAGQYKQLLDALCVDSSQVFPLFSRLRAEIDGTILAAAVCQYRAMFEQWPPSLDVVPADTMSRMTRDEHFGSTFLYRLVDGWPLLYHVGEDGRDDGGKPRIAGVKEGSDGILLAPPKWSARFAPSSMPSATTAGDAPR